MGRQLWFQAQLAHGDIRIRGVVLARPLLATLFDRGHLKSSALGVLGRSRPHEHDCG